MYPVLPGPGRAVTTGQQYPDTPDPGAELDCRTTLNQWTENGDLASQRKQIVDCLLEGVNAGGELELARFRPELLESLPATAMKRLAIASSASARPLTRLTLPLHMSGLPPWVRPLSALCALKIGLVCADMELDLRGFECLQSLELSLNVGRGFPYARFLLHLNRGCAVELLKAESAVDLCIVFHRDGEIIEEVFYPYRTTGHDSCLNNGSEKVGDTIAVCRLWSTHHVLSRARHHLTSSEPWQFPPFNCMESVASQIDPVIFAQDKCSGNIWSSIVANADRAYAVEDLGAFLAEQQCEMEQVGDDERYLMVRTCDHLLDYVLTRRADHQGTFTLSYYDPNTTLDEFNRVFRGRERIRQLTWSNHVDGFRGARAVSDYFRSGTEAFGAECFACVAVYRSAQNVVRRMLSSPDSARGVVSLKFISSRLHWHPAVTDLRIQRGDVELINEMRRAAGNGDTFPVNAMGCNQVSAIIRIGRKAAAFDLIDLLGECYGAGNRAVLKSHLMQSFEDRSPYDAAISQGIKWSTALASRLIDFVEKGWLDANDVVAVCRGEGSPSHCKWLMNGEEDKFTAHVDFICKLAEGDVLDAESVFRLMPVLHVKDMPVRMLAVYLQQLGRLLKAGHLQKHRAISLCDFAVDKVGAVRTRAVEARTCDTISARLMGHAWHCLHTEDQTIIDKFVATMLGELAMGRSTYEDALRAGQGASLVDYARMLVELRQIACLSQLYPALKQAFPHLDDTGRPLYLAALDRGDRRTVVAHAQAVALLRRANIVPPGEADAYAVGVGLLPQAAGAGRIAVMSVPAPA